MSDRKSPLVPIAVAVIAMISLILIVVASGGEEEPQRAADVVPGGSSPRSGVEGSDDPLEQIVRREEGDPMAIGDVDAPVVMIAYSEFQCPFCGKFARDTAPTLEEKYVDEGVLRIEWRDFPYLGEESVLAARAGRAAAAQASFWEFHDAMFADQLPPNSGRLTEDHVAGIAEEIGLDVERFRADLDSEPVRKLVDADFEEGQSIGVTGTPSFLINGTPIVGAQPTEVFEQVIEEASGAAS
ncbi:DsbA family protein [Nocardioides pacificus]